ncbi:hypothetical protein [Streptomyces sp. MMG1533]|uniref:hypothetical protein n=1 Tax=Streptomyces sp. MMG1533 TaxID=1415546 RepID=UPI0007C80AD2|nr:hypothetical protein [Streptomyces sp. MMG1533]
MEEWFGVASIAWVIAGVFGLIFLVPFLDRSPKRRWRERKIALGAAAVLLLALAAITIEVWIATPRVTDEHHRPTARTAGFWALSITAVCASAALYEGLCAAPGPGAGLLVLTSALVLVVSAVQAARTGPAGRSAPPSTVAAHPLASARYSSTLGRGEGQRGNGFRASRTGQAPAEVEDAGHADEGHHH